MSYLSDKIHSIRFKLIASLIAVSILIGLISVLVGGNVLYHAVIEETKNRVQQDLNVARLIYNGRVDEIRQALEITVSSPIYHDAGARLTTDTATGAETLHKIMARLQLDFVGITDGHGRLTYHYGTKEILDISNTNALVSQVLEKKKTVSGTLMLDHFKGKPSAPLQTIKATSQPSRGDSRTIPHAIPHKKILIIGAAIPLFMEGSITQVVYGGNILNHSVDIVDKIGETVFKNEVYHGRNVGTATIFSDNVRISTSVKRASGERALGTLASDTVTRQVLNNGEQWIGRAKVLDDWYITSYEAISDMNGNRVGMLYVGVLEAKYSDVRKNGIAVFAGITIAGIFIAIVLGWLFTKRIMQPVTYLINASTEISSGNFTPNIGPISRDDIGRLQKKFLIMMEALKEREKRQKVEQDKQLIQSEKQASVGKLAAGVAHEINNPLTAVLTFTHLILRRGDIPDEVRADLETVASQTERVRGIVKSLLDFSRQTHMTFESIDLNRLIEDSIGLMKNQALIKDIHLNFKQGGYLPQLTLDHNQFQSVLINLIINAMDATPSGGKIEIQTRRADTFQEDGVEIQISDTGTGIDPEHMDKLFDPFFTTKRVGKGTGLGLAVTAGIIDRHGGKIDVQSEVNQGTTFKIWMPCESSEDFQNDDTEQEAYHENLGNR